MAKIVAGIGMSHAPGALGWPDAPSASVRRRLLQAADRLGRSLDAARPDVIIAFLDDHFENHFRSLMPTVGIGVADSHPGPATQWLEALRLTRQERFGGAPRLPNGCCGRWSPMDTTSQEWARSNTATT